MARRERFPAPGPAKFEVGQEVEFEAPENQQHLSGLNGYRFTIEKRKVAYGCWEYGHTLHRVGSGKPFTRWFMEHQLVGG